MHAVCAGVDMWERECGWVVIFGCGSGWLSSSYFTIFALIFNRVIVKAVVKFGILHRKPLL